MCTFKLLGRTKAVEQHGHMWALSRGVRGMAGAAAGGGHGCRWTAEPRGAFRLDGTAEITAGGAGRRATEWTAVG